MNRQRNLRQRAGTARRPALDLLRILAAFLVILTHTVQKEMASVDLKGPVWDALWVFPMICNPLYVMLSGALVYQDKRESVSGFFRKRFFGMLLPMIVFYIGFVYADVLVNGAQHGNISYYIASSLLYGRTPEAPHYWLLYILISLYLTAPLMRMFLRGLDNRSLDVMAFLLLLYLLVRFGISLAGNTLGFGMQIGDWLAVSLIGFWLASPAGRRWTALLLAAGAAGGAYIMYSILTGAGKEFLSSMCCNQAVPSLFLAMGIFALVDLTGSLPGPAASCVTFLSRYSYGVILVHWAVLCFVIRQVLKITAAGAAPGMRIALSVGLNIVISLVISVISFGLVFFPLRRLLGR